MLHKIDDLCRIKERSERRYRTEMNCATILPSEVIPDNQALTVPSDGIATDRMLERTAGFQ